MRITYLMESVGLTGGNVVLFHHMEALARDNHDVFMLAPFGETRWNPGTLSNLGSTVSVPGYDGIWEYAKKVQKAVRRKLPGIERRIMTAFRGDTHRRSADITRRLLSKWQPSDITVATHSLTAQAAALVADKSQAFYHMQGYEPWFSDESSFQSIAEQSYRLPLIKIANCQWLLSKVGALTGDEIKLVHPGLNHEVFYPKELFAKRKRERIEKNQVKIVSYADHRLLKGWLDSQDAMRKVFDQLSGEFDIDWTVFGSVESGDVGVPITYRGFLSHQQLAELYSETDLIFVPSWFESFPLQPIEAMACGAAVVTTEIGTEDYARNNETALVVEPRNPEALANAVIELIRNHDKRRYLAAAGTRESKKFTWEQSASEIKMALGL